MSTCIVHVGLTKAASTTLQEYFKSRRDVCLLDRYRSCDLLATKNAFLYDAALAHEFFSSGISRAHQLGRVAVVSHERLSGNPHSGHYDAAEIAERLRTLLVCPKILLCIREQYSLIASCYKQYVRIGGVRTLEDYVFPVWDHRVPQFEWRFYRYDKLINHYHSMFSRDNVKVVLIEDLARNSRDFFSEIDTFMGISSVPFSGECEVFNPGLDDKYIDRTRFANFLSPDRCSIRDQNIFAEDLTLVRMMKSATEHAPKEQKVSIIERLKEKLAGSFAESNRAAGGLIGRDLSSLGYET